MRNFKNWSAPYAFSAVLSATLAVHSGVVVAEMDTVRIATTSISSDATFFIADKKGYFKQEGLNALFINFNSGAKMIAPLGAGQLDVGGGSATAGLYNAIARGINVKIVADKGSMPTGYGFTSIMVRKDLIDSGKFKSFADMKGLTVAMGAEGTSGASAVNEALKIGGLKYSDIKVVTMGYPQHLLAFRNKAIDASLTSEPTVTRAMKEGVAVRFSTNDTFYPNEQVAVVLYGDEFIKSRPAVAKRFMRAYIKAVRFYNDALKDGKLAGPNAEEVIAILTEYTNIKDAGVYRAITPSGCNPDGLINMSSLEKDFQFFKEQGYIEGNVSVGQAVDNSFAAAVAKELGPYSRKAN